MKLLINNKKISRPFRLSIKVPVYIYARGVPCRRETVFIISGQGGYTALCNTPDLNRNVEPLAIPECRGGYKGGKWTDLSVFGTFIILRFKYHKLQRGGRRAGRQRSNKSCRLRLLCIWSELISPNYRQGSITVSSPLCGGCDIPGPGTFVPVASLPPLPALSVLATLVSSFT